MIIPVDYILKFNSDFYQPIIEKVKTSTIRASSKPLKIGDICYTYFPDIQTVMFLMITDHYARKLHDLNKNDALNEGYNHEDLLKRELKNIYPELKDDDYVYIYRFQGVQCSDNDKKVLEEFLEKQLNDEVE